MVMADLCEEGHVVFRSPPESGGGIFTSLTALVSKQEYKSLDEMDEMHGSHRNV